jgi:hypothetical protein
MNSLTLKEKGFTDFVALNGLPISSLPHNEGGVLVFVDTTLKGKPVSDILYIGKSKKMAKKVFGGYLAGYGGKTTKKISEQLLNDRYIEKVTISWMLSDNPKATQKELLNDFHKEHGEYPAWNASKKTTVKPKLALKNVKSRPSRKVAAKPTL